MRQFFVWLSMVVLLTLSVGVLGPVDDPIRLQFGLYTSSKPSTLVRQFKPVLNELENAMTDKLDRDVDIVIHMSRSYEDGVQALVDGTVDFSRFGPASYVEAHELNPDITVVAMEAVKGEKVFYGIIAVQKDSDIESIEDLRGRSFAFGDESSTIGRYLSQLYLANSDIRADDLAKYEYLGRHDDVGYAVSSGGFDAGALNEKTFNKLVAEGENLRILAKFPNVTKPWIVGPTVDPAVVGALWESLTEMEPSNPALKRLKVTGFLSGSDADYETIRRSIQQNGEFFAEPSK